MSSNRKSQRDGLRSFIRLPGRGLRCVFPEYQILGVPPLAACVAWAVACANAFITCGTKLELFNNVSRLAELYYSQRRYAVAGSFVSGCSISRKGTAVGRARPSWPALHWLAEMNRAQGRAAKIGDPVVSEGQSACGF
jgi:hypothetical protein